LRPYGHYIGPISIFPGKYQEGLSRLFSKSREPIDFGIGYRWRSQGSNLLMAVRTDAPPPTASTQAGSVSEAADAVAQPAAIADVAPAADAEETKSTDRNRSASNKHRDRSGGRSNKRHVAYRAPWFFWSGAWR
jgi:hypothetical protein